MENNINFKGAIILKQPTKSVMKNIIPKLGKHNQIYDNYGVKGDVLCITRKVCDKDVAEELTHHRTKFEFYTDLSTKSGFDREKPDENKNILASTKEKVLTTKDELINFFKLKEIKPPFSKKRKDNPIENSLKALGFDNQKVKQRNGYSEVINSDGKLLARISGPGQYGISFAFVEPKNMDESPLRYALRGGEIIFQYTSESGRAQFLKNYNNAVKANKAVVKQEATHIGEHQ